MSIEAFLQELSELSRRHGIIIGGCGCCGSPWLMTDVGHGTYEIEKGEMFQSGEISWDNLKYIHTKEDKS